MALQDPEHEAAATVAPSSDRPLDAGASERASLLSHRVDSRPSRYGGTDASSLQDAAPDYCLPEDDQPQTSPVATISLLLIGVLIANADTTLVLATYGTISSEFAAFSSGSWLTTAYSLACTAVQPIVGKLSDIYGRKRVLITSYVLFGLGTVICGISQSMWQVIVGRIVSGVGSAGMTVIVSILITDLVPLIQVAAWRSYVNVVSTLGRSIGGPLGGLLADTIGWRWSFIGQGPLIFLAIVLVSLNLPSQTREESLPLKGQPSKLRRIDFIGASLLASTLVALLGALSIGGQIVPWSHPTVIGLLGVSVGLVLLFIVFESNYALEPVFPLSLVCQRDVATSYGIMAMQVAAQLSMMFSVPLYFQVTQSASNTTAGAHLFPAVLGNTIGGLAAGFTIQKSGKYKSLTIIAPLVSAVAYLLMILRWTGHTTWLESMEIIPGGLGTGMASAATFIALTSSVQKAEVAIATGGMYLASSVGMVGGIAVGSTVQQSGLRSILERKLVGKGGDKLTPGTTGHQDGNFGCEKSCKVGSSGAAGGGRGISEESGI
ncbi:MFS general substrate transporter-47 [Coleophoma cylindrospora]|uniref:MFS general substrate transporter-47 n=1 Tax=Coleophoma cylindrospora TaxID=1849047 RepID=A0A3D8S8B6_9HELO|nr:MFS general substrate transporter-47 [Coleophoma cylindrospora]